MGIFDNYNNPNVKDKQQWEEYFSIILADEEFHQKVTALCNIVFMEKFTPLSDYDDYGFRYNMDGMVFAENDNGVYYILLEDGSIAVVDYAENECGRVAETLKDLLELELNCAFAWQNYMRKYYIDDPSLLEKDVLQFEAQGRTDFEDVYGDDMPEYDELQKEVAQRLHLNIYNDIDKNILPKLYKVATKQPKFLAKNIDDNSPVNELIPCF